MPDDSRNLFQFHFISAFPAWRLIGNDRMAVYLRSAYFIWDGKRRKNKGTSLVSFLSLHVKDFL